METSHFKKSLPDTFLSAVIQPSHLPSLDSQTSPPWLGWWVRVQFTHTESESWSLWLAADAMRQADTTHTRTHTHTSAHGHSHTHTHTHIYTDTHTRILKVAQSHSHKYKDTPKHTHKHIATGSGKQKGREIAIKIGGVRGHESHPFRSVRTWFTPPPQTFFYQQWILMT